MASWPLVPVFRKAAKSPRRSRKSDAPRWDLSDLYTGLDSEALAEDRAQLDEDIKNFRDTHRHTIAASTGAELGAMMEEYESIVTRLQYITHYVHLLQAENTQNITATHDLEDWTRQQHADLSFVSHEFYHMNERDLLLRMADPMLASYAPWIGVVRADVRHAEEALAEEGLHAGQKYRLALEKIMVDVPGGAVPYPEASAMMDEAEDSKKRDAIRQAIGAALKEAAPDFAVLYNEIAAENIQGMRDGGYDRTDARHYDMDRVPMETFDAMAAEIGDALQRFAHKYDAWRNQEHDLVAAPDYSWDEARRTVVRAFRRVSPALARIAGRLFEAEHIDAAPVPEKEVYAFTLSSAPGVLPYIMMSFTGESSEIAALLGHEVGHGVHQVLAERAQGLLLSEMTTPVSETASLFAEALVLDEMIDAGNDPDIKKAIQADRLEAMYSNVFDQFSYHVFERRAHDAAVTAPATAEQLSDIWESVQKDFTGGDDKPDDFDRYSWMTVPHFFDNAFYVYGYTCAQLAVNALHGAWLEAKEEGEEARGAFAENLTAFLESGLTLNLDEGLNLFGFDPSDRAFWREAIAVMEQHFDALTQSLAGPDKPKPSTPPPKPS
ncbi:MAG: M3 family metallopeptidase [Alphaproteobacteria bacterium]|nr:M3 family metallopeptidase [Alphaproteobacteria bacterium]